MRFLPILMLLGACGKTELPLKARLRHPDATVRSNAIWEVQDLKPSEAAAPLIAALSDSTVNVRVSAAMILEHRDIPEAHAALIRALQDPDDQVRQWAMMALGHAGDTDALPALRRARSGTSADDRHYAEAAIVEIEAALQATDVRYHPPASTPKELTESDRDVYLKAHRDQWTFIVSRTAPDEMAHKELTVPIGTICEAPPVVTAGAYAGQKDVVAFLSALRRRCSKNPAAVGEFSTLRESCVKLHPQRPDEDR